MAESNEFEVFIEECRKVGLADMKSVEAAWSNLKDVVPEASSGVGDALMELLMRGAEYARALDAAERNGELDG